MRRISRSTLQNRLHAARRGSVLAALAACALLATPMVQASEGGSHNTPAGAFTFSDAIFPAPGETAFMGYFVWIRPNSLRGNNGEPLPGANFRADLAGHAGRLVHTWNLDWHGFHLSSSANYLVAYAHTNFNGIHDGDADLSAFNVEPIIVTRTFETQKLGTVNWMIGVNLWYPVGHDEPRGAGANPDPHFLANGAIHAHYATGIVETAVTWKPRPKLQIDWENYVAANFTNHRTGYRSGDLFGTELGITTWPFDGLPRLGVGVNGYYLHQFQNDRVGGIVFPDHKLTQTAAGPQVVYAFASQTVVSVRWQHHLRTDNGANGDQFWMLFYLPVKL